MTDHKTRHAAAPMYQPGRIAYHATGEEGAADVGVSLGLGDRRMIYAGELPDVKGHGLVFYQMGGDRRIVAEGVDLEAAEAMLIEIRDAAFGKPVALDPEETECAPVGRVANMERDKG